MTREDDAKVATMLGWTWTGKQNGNLIGHPPNQAGLTYEYSVPHYTSDVADDYLVLEFVRENWAQQRLRSLASWLSDKFDDRAADHEEDYENSWNDILMYRPGDYSRAVIAVAEAEESE